MGRMKEWSYELCNRLYAAYHRYHNFQAAKKHVVQELMAEGMTKSWLEDQIDAIWRYPQQAGHSTNFWINARKGHSSREHSKKIRIAHRRT